MSIITDNTSEIDPELRGSVDFNFFESPRKRDSPEKMPSGDHEGGMLVGEEVVGKQHGGPKKADDDFDRNNSSDDSYSDESFSDSDSSSSSSSSSSRSRSRTPKREEGSINSGTDLIPVRVEKIKSRSRSHSSSSRSSESSRSRSRSSSYDKTNSKSTVRPTNDSSGKGKNKDRSRKLKKTYDKRRGSEGLYSSDDSSDSDMTDVSPLNSREGTPSPSPRTVAVQSFSQEKNVGKKPRKSKGERSRDDTLLHESRKQKGKSKGKGGGTLDREQFDLNLLMQAVIELDKEQMQSQHDGKKVMFIPPHIRKKIEKNYSFNDDQLNDIDRENQRLLREIMRQNRQRKKRSATQEPEVRRPSHSAVNRRREHQRVEEENLKFLHRLQAIRPTKGMSRQDQLKDYHRQVTYGVPSPQKSFSRTTSWDDEGAQSLASFESGDNRRYRPVSAKVRPQSGKLRPQSGKSLSRPVSAKVVDRRPAWDDRW